MNALITRGESTTAVIIEIHEAYETSREATVASRELAVKPL